MPYCAELQEAFQPDITRCDCIAPAEVLLAPDRCAGNCRSARIWGTAIRQDRAGLGKLVADIGTGYWNALEIGGEVIEVDTTENAAMDLGATYGRIRAVL